MRHGFTLPELVVVCTLIALVAGIAIPKTRYVLDGLRLRQAAHEVAGAVTLARAAAIRRGAFAQLVVDDSTGSVRVESDGDTLWRRDLTRNHGVLVRASRDTVLYAPTGLGFGVANSTIVVSIGERAETVTVSRLGRMRTSY
jgi:prepilin-type N-terminal cleavage/methylation domain-containing protein